MKMNYISLLLTPTLLLLLACGGEDSKEQQAHDDHPEGGSVTMTAWTDSLEVFIEYASPAKAGKVKFLTHLTRIADWSPIDAGTVVLYVKGPDGVVHQSASDRALRPGIYNLVQDFPTDGSYEMRLVYFQKGVADTCLLPDISIGSKHEHAEDATGISFLKEQQWKGDFSTEWVKARPVRAAIQVSAELQAPAGKMVDISSPVAGTILAQSLRSLPPVGSWVKAGSVLAVLSPDPGSANGLAQVRAEYLGAKADYERVQRLHETGAVSGKRYDEARLRYDAARAGYELLQKSMMWENSENETTLRIKSPISGYLEQIGFRPGQHIDAGQSLFVIADPSRLLLSANVPAAHTGDIAAVTDAWFTVEGFTENYRISSMNGRLVARGNVIDPATRTLRVAFEFDNPGRALSIGLFADTRLESGDAAEVISVPREAIIDESDGVSVVYVQREGESFERRRIKPGRFGELYVEILEGLKAGERIVTRGAQQVRLASMSGSVPEHGHTH